MPEPYGIETAGSFGIGNAYIIVTLGNTNWNTAAGTIGLSYKVGDVFTAAAVGSGTGTARRLVNDSIGRIGGKLLADNLLRDGRDLAFDTDLLYLKISPKVADTVSAGSFQLGVRHKILTTGTTNFLLIGSLSNAPGTIFTATGPGTGTGTADRLDDVALDPNPQSGTGRGVGFNLDNPAYDLQVNSNIDANGFAATSAAYIGNFVISNTNRISTNFGGINIFMTGLDPEARFDTLASSGVFFNENIIGSYTNQNIRIDPNAAGTIELPANTNATGNVFVTGNIGISGNLSKQGNLILGDDVIDGEGNLPENDTVNFAMPFNQSLIPGLDLGYDLGGSIGDSTRGRWAQLHSPSWNDINTIIASSATVSDQVFIGGALHEITTVQSNDDLILDPDTGFFRIENLTITDDVLSTAVKDLIPNNLPSRPLSTNVGFNLSSDGTSIIVRGATTGTLEKYTMATPYDFQNTVLAQNVSIPAGSAISSSAVRHVYVEENGQYLYRFASLSTNNVTISQYYMSIPFDLTTLLWQKDQTFAHIGTGHPSWTYISPDGTKLFYGNDTILRQLDMTVPYDIATATVTSIDVDPYIISTALPLFFLDAGITAYSARGADGIRFICSTPYDLKTAKITYLTLKSSIFPVSGVANSQRVTLGGHCWVRTIPGSPTIYPQQTELLFQGALNGASNVIVRYIISDLIGIIRNELNTPLKIATTGTGYYRFAGTNAMLIPAGSDATRPPSPEIGDTRWNTDQGYLECFDGSVYVVATGGGIEVTTDIMEDLGHVYTLMLG